MSRIASRWRACVTHTSDPGSRVASSLITLPAGGLSPAARALSVAIGAGVLLVLTGCGGVSEVTKERVSRSETVVRQAEQTIGNSESGALELQRSKDTLERARQALADEKGEAAERFAQQAQLDAELAIAKSQSAAAREAADELMASIQTLRREAARSPGQATRDEPMTPRQDMRRDPGETRDRMQMQEEQMQEDQMQEEMQDEMGDSMQMEHEHMPPER